jgi:1,4-dihydroxy-2-naphthoate octaprenyltransferase
MGRTSFVACLYVMAAACVVIAISDRSWGWLIGSAIFFGVATAARRALKKEHETGREAPRLGFVGFAMLGMVAVMGILFWIQFSA